MVLPDFIQRSACAVAGFKARGVPPRFAATPPGKTSPESAIPAKSTLRAGLRFPFPCIFHQTLFGHRVTPEIKIICQDFGATTIIFGDDASLVITVSSHNFDSRNMLRELPVLAKMWLFPDHPEKIYKLLEFAARKHASCDFVTTICTLVSFSTLGPPVSFAGS
jgi:hypothetical protein